MNDERTQIALSPELNPEAIESWVVPFGLDRTLEAVEHSGFDTEYNVVTVTELQVSDIESVEVKE